MLTERLSYLPEELPSFRPCPAASQRAGWTQLPGSARQRLLAAGEAEAAQPLAPLSLSLWLDFIRTGPAGRMGGGLLFPPGPPVRPGRRRVRGIPGPLSGRHRRHRLGHLRGERLAAARPQLLCPGHPSAGPARHRPPPDRSVCRRGGGPAGHRPLSAGPRAGGRLSRPGLPDGAGDPRPHPDALPPRPLLVDGQRGRAHVQLDQLVHPERPALLFPPAQREPGGSARRRRTGRLQPGLLPQRLRPRRLLQ